MQIFITRRSRSNGTISVDRSASKQAGLLAMCIIDQNPTGQTKAPSHHWNQSIAPALDSSGRTVANDQIKVAQHQTFRHLIPFAFPLTFQRDVTNPQTTQSELPTHVANMARPAFVILIHSDIGLSFSARIPRRMVVPPNRIRALHLPRFGAVDRSAEDSEYRRSNRNCPRQKSGGPTTSRKRPVRDILKMKRQHGLFLPVRIP